MRSFIMKTFSMWLEARIQNENTVEAPIRTKPKPKPGTTTPVNPATPPAKSPDKKPKAKK
jgi:hypothetical protein